MSIHYKLMESSNECDICLCAFLHYKPLLTSFCWNGALFVKRIFIIDVNLSCGLFFLLQITRVFSWRFRRINCCVFTVLPFQDTAKSHTNSSSDFIDISGLDTPPYSDWPETSTSYRIEVRSDEAPQEGTYESKTYSHQSIYINERIRDLYAANSLNLLTWGSVPKICRAEKTWFLFSCDDIAAISYRKPSKTPCETVTVYDSHECSSSVFQILLNPTVLILKMRNWLWTKEHY